MNRDRQLDRLERMLLSCIEASKRERREKRKQSREQPDEMTARVDEWLRQQRDCSRPAQRRDG